jgi:hypothetical protein
MTLKWKVITVRIQEGIPVIITLVIRAFELIIKPVDPEDQKFLTFVMLIENEL